MSSDNCTYITMAATTTVTPSPCEYKICKCSTDVCRIKFDFQVSIASSQAPIYAKPIAAAHMLKYSYDPIRNELNLSFVSS